MLKLKVDAYIADFGHTLGEELLTPTRIYVDTINSLIRDLSVHGLAHITGGGFTDNILRVVPDACNVILRTDSWDIPPIFPFLQDAGKVTDMEMMRTFNNGIGMVAIVPEDTVPDVLGRLNGMDQKGFVIGEVVERKKPINGLNGSDEKQ